MDAPLRRHKINHPPITWIHSPSLIVLICQVVWWPFFLSDIISLRFAKFISFARQTIGITMAKFDCIATAVHCCGTDQLSGVVGAHVVAQVDTGIKWSIRYETEDTEHRWGSSGHWEWKLAGYPNLPSIAKEWSSFNSWARISWNEINIWITGEEYFAQHP